MPAKTHKPQGKPAGKNNNDPRNFLTAMEEFHAKEDSQSFGMSFRFGNQDLAIASLSIVQPTSLMQDGKKHVGEWYNNLTREFSSSVEVVVVAFERPRTMMPEKDPNTKNKAYNPNEKPICASHNGVFPYRQFVGTEYQGEEIPPLCEECVFAQTGQCWEKFKYYGILPARGGNVRKFAYRPTAKSKYEAKRWNTMIQEDLSLGEFWTYRLDVVEGDQWYVLQVDRAQQVTDPGTIEMIIQMNQEYERAREAQVNNVMALVAATRNAE